jgi:uncharacterized DUF497 family protein
VATVLHGTQFENVVHVEQGTRDRIISARFATKTEREQYGEQG